MEGVLGNSIGAFLGLTVACAGFIAWMTGQALALTWKPAWHAIGYSLLLGGANRFLAYGLFDGVLLSLPAYLSNTALLVCIALLGYRYNRVRVLARQYPWKWRSNGPFRLRRSADEGPN